MSTICERYSPGSVASRARADSSPPTLAGIDAAVSRLGGELVTRYSSDWVRRIRPDGRFCGNLELRLSYDLLRHTIDAAGPTIYRMFDGVPTLRCSATAAAELRRAIVNLVLERWRGSGYLASSGGLLLSLGTSPSRVVFPTDVVRRLLQAVWQLGWQPHRVWTSAGLLAVLAVSGPGHGCRLWNPDVRLREAAALVVDYRSRVLLRRAPYAMIGAATDDGQFIPIACRSSDEFERRPGGAAFREWLNANSGQGVPRVVALAETLPRSPKTVLTRPDGPLLRAVFPRQFIETFLRRRLGLWDYEQPPELPLSDLGLLCADAAELAPLLYRIRIWRRFVELARV